MERRKERATEFKSHRIYGGYVVHERDVFILCIFRNRSHAVHVHLILCIGRSIQVNNQRYVKHSLISVNRHQSDPGLFVVIT